MLTILRKKTDEEKRVVLVAEYKEDKIDTLKEMKEVKERLRFLHYKMKVINKFLSENN